MRILIIQKFNSNLDKLDNQPKLQAEKKGQISEGLRISEKEKFENESIINETDDKIDKLRKQLNEIQEQSIQIRERKASSGATIEGLKKRKTDLLERIESELNLNENNILEFSKIFSSVKFSSELILSTKSILRFLSPSTVAPELAFRSLI